MGAVLRNSTLYDSRDSNKYLQDRRDIGGPVVPIRFALTVVSASTSGDTYNLFTMPANWMAHGLFVVSEAMGASAGAGRTLIIGDSGDTDRLVASTDVDALNAAGVLAAAGMHWAPTADTIVYATSGGGAWVVGKIIKGTLFAVAGA